MRLCTFISFHQTVFDTQKSQRPQSHVIAGGGSGDGITVALCWIFATVAPPPWTGTAGGGRVSGLCGIRVFADGLAKTTQRGCPATLPLDADVHQIGLEWPYLADPGASHSSRHSTVVCFRTNNCPSWWMDGRCRFESWNETLARQIRATETLHNYINTYLLQGPTDLCKQGAESALRNSKQRGGGRRVKHSHCIGRTAVRIILIV